MNQNGVTATRRELNEERMNLKVKPSFKKKIEGFTQRHDDMDQTSVLREGADTLMNGYLPVLGRIPCGPISEAIAATPYYEIVPPVLKPRADLGDYILEASGDSMEPRITSGDWVILRPDTEPAQGDICALQIYRDKGHEGDCEATLKRLIRESGHETVILRPINPEYKDIVVPADMVKVVGVFRGLIRRNG